MRTKLPRNLDLAEQVALALRLVRQARRRGLVPQRGKHDLMVGHVVCLIRLGSVRTVDDLLRLRERAS